MKQYLHLFFALLIIFWTGSCKPVSSPITVKICNQVWATKNLDVDKYANGDPIPEVNSITKWDTLTTGAYCYYNYGKDSAENAVYGKLYNWYAVNDTRGLAPKGWHIPTQAEFIALVNCLGNSGGELKATDFWYAPNKGATNSTGFTALPSGWRAYSVFNNRKYSGTWWSATEANPSQASNMYLYYSSSLIHLSQNNKQSGFSVRCLKD